MVTASILIITGNRTIASDLREHLQKLGYRFVGVATTEAEALSKIEEFKPDLILTDILNRTGEKIKTGKLIQTRYNLPVIFITGSIGQATIQRARSTAPFGYIYKPFDDQQLLVTIETALTRHIFEKKLRESRQWLNTTLTSIGDGIIATDEKGRVRFINPAATELTGWRHLDAIGRPLQEIFVLSDDASPKRLDIPAIREKPDYHFENVLFSRSGRSMPVEGHATIIPGAMDEALGMVLVFRDITKQRASLLEIQRQAERAETLLQVAARVNSEIELETVLDKICEAAARILRSAGAAILLKDAKRDIFRIVAVTGDTRLVENYRGAQFETPVSAFHSLIDPPHLAEITLDARSYPNLQAVELFRKLDIQTIALAPLLHRGIMIGILTPFFPGRFDSLPADERKLIRGMADQAGIAIANASSFEQVRASRERQQFLARKLVEVQEDERRSLARELHDEIGQMLTGLQFTLKSLMSNSTDEQKSRIDEAQIVVSAIISQIRELSINLRPSMLDDLGILPTLEWYLDRFEAKTGIRVNFQHQNLDQRFYPELETAAFRIVQEALTNVARYAETEFVEVRIVVPDSVMQIEIRDQGRGFDMAGVAKHQSLGLEGMRERAYAIGGLLEIQSEPGMGTHIQASLPISGHIERRTRERDRSSGR
jgi:PAS domain S-box-containing protein